MAMFNSYVTLPEGTSKCYCFWKPRHVHQRTRHFRPPLPVSSFLRSRWGTGKPTSSPDLWFIKGSPVRSCTRLWWTDSFAKDGWNSWESSGERFPQVLEKNWPFEHRFFDLTCFCPCMTSCFVIPRFYYLDVLSEYHPILKIIFIGWYSLRTSKLYWMVFTKNISEYHFNTVLPFSFLAIFDWDFSESPKRLTQNSGRYHGSQ